MSENQSKSETGNQNDYQPSQDNMRGVYENPDGDNANLINDNERGTPQEFPDRHQHQNYKVPSVDQNEYNEEEDDVYDVNTDEEIVDEHDENEEAEPVDEQSLDAQNLK